MIGRRLELLRECPHARFFLPSVAGTVERRAVDGAGTRSGRSRARKALFSQGSCRVLGPQREYDSQNIREGTGSDRVGNAGEAVYTRLQNSADTGERHVARSSALAEVRTRITAFKYPLPRFCQCRHPAQECSEDCPLLWAIYRIAGKSHQDNITQIGSGKNNRLLGHTEIRVVQVPGCLLFLYGDQSQIHD